MGIVLGYVRVSTSHSDQEASYEAQEVALKAAGCVRVIKEKKSGFKGVRRPGFETYKELIASGQLSGFMIVSLSRLTRRQETAELSELCNQHGVEFTALTGGSVDVSTPEGLLNVGIQDTVNRFDSLIKSVRVKAGLQASREKGKTACGRTPFGWVYCKEEGKPVPDEKNWHLAQRLWKDLAEVEFRANVVLRYQRWIGVEGFYRSASGVYGWLKNPILMGMTKYSNHAVTPLVTPQEFAHCRKVLESRTFISSRAPREIRLFTQKIICDNCGRTLIYCMSNYKWRMKCLHHSCSWYGKGLAEFKVRKQVFQALRDSVDQMAERIEPPTQSKTPILTAEQIEAKRDLEMFEMLQSRGHDVSEKSLAQLRAKLAVPIESPAVDWKFWADLIRQNDLLEFMTDIELRSVLTELIEEIRYVGDSSKVKISLAVSAKD